MNLTYEDALDENPVISRDKAIRECELHSISFDALVAELGDHQTYMARELLIWLGY
ncbi:hypothetical protein ACI77O_12665 [Pseudomonas tritici]|uniref:hypothetical protein n=1 Tax=Pseudomonas tritici TaxID=2745518 RepID=UPI00387AED35